MESLSSESGENKFAINEQRAMRRREMARGLKNVRSRLGASEYRHTTFDLERQHLFADTRINAAYAVPLLSLIVAAISVLWINPLYIGAWFAVTLCTHIAMVVTSHAYEKAPSDQKARVYWRKRFTMGDFIYGCSWASFFLLPQTAGSGDGFVIFHFATLLIVVAMNTMQSATLPKCLLASTIPMTLLVTFSFLKQVDPIHYTLAAMAIGAQGFFFILGNQLLKNANTMLEYRAEKDHLIAELETANAMSDEARRRAEAANIAKSRFLATMSHELRTPLNAILGFSEIMKNEVLGAMHNKNYRSYAEDIHGSGQHLLNLINEILDLSRIEAGRHELHEEPLFLDDIVDECGSMMKVRADAKSIVLHHTHEPDLPKVWADERALRQVVLNLMSNAVKFTPVGGKVRIRIGLTSDGGQYVSIQDTGPGIPEEEIPTVLEAFGQGTHAIKSAEPGTGLGLSIVQALIAMHDGNFNLKSKPGVGTEVIVTLPRARVMNYAPDVDWVDPDDKKPSFGDKTSRSA
ncbi:HAMP domain-containing sensor histidine kinase [Labrenzia sp. OB1]|uniref:sensor histidine kinase n=1 Tax=Labrenzia sp. OB1 TaxID=1561204 RepID=UPI0007B2B10B|nr:HAMP domain-containing sensor histidine kinase [Labrenzia sp. OB1]KZM50228.1 ATPase [Labrenzia sp. OB1]